MRLSEWRAGAPVRDALGPRVLAVVEPVLSALGAEPDPHAWVAWGDDPGVRHVLFVPTAAGLIVCHVRTNIPTEGARANARVVRWSRVQVGELGIETQAGHRVASFQVEGQVLRGPDATGDRIAAFGLAVLAAIDGRHVPDPGGAMPRRARGSRKPAAAAAKAAKPQPGARRAAPTARATGG